jgi:hypothetical protein
MRTSDAASEYESWCRHEVAAPFIYGVVSYVVSQRTSENRSASCAQPRNVAAMIVRQGGLVAGRGRIFSELHNFSSAIQITNETC